MLSPEITITGKAKVRLAYPSLPNFELNMDFNPLIDKFKLAGNFCLMHWQAKPFGLRRWGIYDNEANTYLAAEWNQIQCLSIPEFLQINEEIIKTVPTATLLFRNSKVLLDEYISISPKKT